MKKIIQVEIKNIEVSDKYYSFDYRIFCEGFIDVEDSYEGDYENGMTPKEWKEELEAGEAMRTAISQEIS